MIHWNTFDPSDESTQPGFGETVLVMCLKGGKARIYTEAFLDARGAWWVLVRDKEFRQKGSTLLGDYDPGSLAWTNVNLPPKWRKK